MDEPKVYKGKIKGFTGSWMSGVANLVVENDLGEIDHVLCENSPTVRVLEQAFGDVIGEDHTVKPDGGHVDKIIYYAYDDLGMILGGFVKAEDASPELVEAYERQN